MNLLQAVISGALQGVAEFLPISSSGHLVILHNLFGVSKPQLLFDIFLHLGTLIAVLIFFRKEIGEIFVKEHKTLRFLIISSIPTAIIGYFFADEFERMFGEVRIVGWMLILTAVCLFLGSFAAKFKWAGQRPMNVWRALFIGVLQGLAIAPGISRSGITIAGALGVGIKKEESFRYSFLLSIPAIFGAVIFKMAHEAVANVANNVGAVSIAVGTVVAACVGLASLRILRDLVIKGKLYIFGIYCILAGGLILIL